MQKKIKMNINQRYIFKTFEKNRLVLKILVNNLLLKNKKRQKIQQHFFSFPKNSSLSRIKNLCILTGRPKSIYRFFKISRLQFRKLASKGYLTGISKYSW
jgi:small subunit ribosomal protein S14